jgi:hypothetical protein
MFTESKVWLNTTDYSTLELTLFALGCLGWVVVYLVVLRHLLRKRFVEIPAAAVAANIAWEFVWGFVYQTNMGRLFILGYQAWFFLDLFIVIGLFRYGYKQLLNPSFGPFLRPAVTFGILAWTAGLYFFVKMGYDTVTGATTGYILNVMMSALYIVVFLGLPRENFSYLVAWGKFLGTALISIFCFMVWPERPFLLTLCVVTFLLDLFYVLIFHWRMSTRSVTA